VLHLYQTKASVVQDGTAFVSKGLLDNQCQGVDGQDKLAVVLGHEMAHALQRHGGERLSHGGIITVVLTGATFVSSLLGLGSANIWNALAILHLQESAAMLMLLLPQSRRCEHEADTVGIFVTSAACYDPAAGPKLWKEWNGILDETNPAKLEEKLSPRQRKLLSYMTTHPTSEDREQALLELFPDAERHRRKRCSQAELDVLEAMKYEELGLEGLLQK
jgi:Zn-dependent protease with chaperone function